MGKILVTGASGFIGRQLLPRLAASGHVLNVTGRSANANVGPHARYFAVGDLGSRTEWGDALLGCDTVIHLAAQVPAHGVADSVYDEVNALGTARLVEQASAAGVQHFVFMSSIFAVTGNSSPAVLDENTVPAPQSPYGRSKLAAEGHVAGFAGPGRNAVSLRIPVVYGAGVQGNWRLLQRVAALPAPLPFAAVDNHRSLIAVDNVADALAHLAALPPDRRRSGTYVLSDGPPVSLAQIISWLRAGMGASARLFPMPASLLRASLGTVGASGIASSLLGDLEVDPRRFQTEFGWAPPVRTEDAVAASGAAFAASRRRS
jgi:UDP-glucose 4-epimerase